MHFAHAARTTNVLWPCACRYPPQGTVIPNMEEVKLYERIKAVTEDPEYQPPLPSLNRPALFQPPSFEHLQKPNRFVLPGAFD